MNIWHDIEPDRISKNDFIAVVEISKNSKQKYELDKSTGVLMLDRILYTSTHYPANYGFIPRTYASDSDPLDVLVLCSESLQPLSIVRCFPIGVISMEDNGKLDDKIIGIPYGDPMYNEYTDIKDLPKHIADEMEHFFAVYKQLEFKATAVSKTAGRGAAQKIIQESIDEYAVRRAELLKGVYSKKKHSPEKH